MEVAPDQPLVRIRSARGKILVVDDASPDGGEWKEDAYHRENMGDDLRENVCELKRRKDGYKCVRYVSRLKLAWANVPGTNMVWQPMMKTICIGPNCGILRRRL